MANKDASSHSRCVGYHHHYLKLPVRETRDERDVHNVPFLVVTPDIGEVQRAAQCSGNTLLLVRFELGSAVDGGSKSRGGFTEDFERVLAQFFGDYWL
jgi:hypothetical protein